MIQTKRGTLVLQVEVWAWGWQPHTVKMIVTKPKRSLARRLLLREARTLTELYSRWWWWWWFNHLKYLPSLNRYFYKNLIYSLFYQISTSLISRVAQSVQCLVTGWTTGLSRFDPRQGQRILPVASVSRPALGPTQPPIQWVPGVLSPGLKSGRGMTLTTHPYLVPRSRMSRSYTSSPPKHLHGV
jgi:hypothetical protein